MKAGEIWLESDLGPRVLGPFLDLWLTLDRHVVAEDLLVATIAFGVCSLDNEFLRIDIGELRSETVAATGHLSIAYHVSNTLYHWCRPKVHLYLLLVIVIVAGGEELSEH